MPSQISSPEPGPAMRDARWSWLLPAGTFLAGCALGGVVMGVADGGGGDEPSATAESAVDAGASGQGDGAADDGAADAPDSGLYVRVPEACLRTADDATTLVEHVDRVVAAVADLQPERLRQTVDDAQQVRDEVREVADQCRAAAAQRLQDVADAEGDDAAPPTPAS